MLEPSISTDTLLSAVERLPDRELELVLQRALKVRAERTAPHLQPAEAELLNHIHHAIPATLQERFNALCSRRDQHLLTPEEHTELLQLTDDIETREAARVTELQQLAALRGVTIEKLLQQLGLSKS
jgi:hypothetical protein